MDELFIEILQLWRLQDPGRRLALERLEALLSTQNVQIMGKQRDKKNLVLREKSNL